MWLIITLILVGILLLFVEVVLLPGVTVAGIAGFISYGVAIYLGFANYGTGAGFIVIGSILVLSIIAFAIAVRSRTWQRLSLRNEIDSTSQPLPENEVTKGDRGMAVTRLAPMGTVIINEKNYEAKSFGDRFLDQKTEVEVVGFENFNVIVKKAGE